MCQRWVWASEQHLISEVNVYMLLVCSGVLRQSGGEEVICTMVGHLMRGHIWM